MQVCFGNYLFKLFKKCMSKHPYQYFVLRFQLFKMYILNLNCKLTLQSLFFLFVSNQDLWETRVINEPSAKASVLICTTVCQHYYFPSKCWGWTVYTLTLGLSYILCLKQLHLLRKKPELKNRSDSFSQWNQENISVVH